MITCSVNLHLLFFFFWKWFQNSFHNSCRRRRRRRPPPGVLLIWWSKMDHLLWDTNFYLLKLSLFWQSVLLSQEIQYNGLDTWWAAKDKSHHPLMMTLTISHSVADCRSSRALYCLREETMHFITFVKMFNTASVIFLYNTTFYWLPCLVVTRF